MAKRPVTIKGMPSLRRALKQAPDEVKKPLQKAVEEGANQVRAEMLRRVPRDSGDLADVISVKMQRDKLGARVGPGIKGKRHRQKAGWRAHFVEFGTQNQPAQPFIFPAFNANKQELLDKFQRAIAHALVKIGEKGD